MIDNVIRIFKDVGSKDFRILTGIELGMKHYEWVPLEELQKFTKYPYGKLQHKLSLLMKNNLIVGTYVPYEGYQIYFDGYDALALNTLVKRGTISAIGDEIGVGKESIVHEAIKESELAIGEPTLVIIKFHREGRTSFTQVKRVREHLSDKEHFSWIYAARLSAKREYDLMVSLYPKVSVPKPIDHNRHAIVMAVAKGSLLSKTRLLQPEWFLDEIISQIGKAYSLGVIHADLSEFNIFVYECGVQFIDWPQYVGLDHPNADELLKRDVFNVLAFFKRKYDIERDVDDVVAGIKHSTSIVG
ncbi:MAG: serine/threonine protein kinase [Methanosarcinaceae archaeon]|nr:serine/threonine protein kinase [Methanosarcinaceae archaeon]